MKTQFTKDYDPNHNFGTDSTYYLGWSWAFDNTSIETKADFLDTYLGYEAATATAQKEILDFNISVTQID